MRNSIKRKLQSAFLLFVLLIIAICGIFYSYVSRLREYERTLTEVDRLQILTLEARKFENNFLTFDTRNPDFMQSGSSKNLAQHNQAVEELKKLLVDLQSKKLVQGMGVGYEMQNISKATNDYSKLFASLATLVRERGFKDSGLEGEMRRAIHELESGSNISNENILTLRRHEKDFFLRKDLSYVEKLAETSRLIETSLANQQDKQRLTSYLTDFSRIVELEKQIGLDETTGDRGKINLLMQDIDARVEGVHDRITENTRGLVNESLAIMAASALIVLAVAALFGLTFANSLSKPIITLDSVARSVVTEGIKDQDKMLDTINSQDEVGSLAKDFKTMLGQLKGYIQEVATQNETLRQVSKAETQRSWRSEGLMKVGEMLRQPNNTLPSRLNEVIFTMVRQLEAHQGAIYTLREEAGLRVMELTAYFSGKKLQDVKPIQLGEGMVGEAWRKKNVMLLKDIQIPDQYARIALGLGYATPKTVLLVPVLVEEYVLGVIEIASLHEIEEHEVEFVKRAAQQIGLHLVLGKLGEMNRTLVQKMQESRAFPSPETIAGTTQEEILEMLRRQQ
jgi:HAMP domain-containing protein/putative methionine-R-sulfoxide reductase with GAF domain